MQQMARVRTMAECRAMVAMYAGDGCSCDACWDPKTDLESHGTFEAMDAVGGDGSNQYKCLLHWLKPCGGHCGYALSMHGATMFESVWDVAASCIDAWEWDGCDRSCFVWHMLQNPEDMRLISMGLLCLYRFGIHVDECGHEVMAGSVFDGDILEEAARFDAWNWRVYTFNLNNTHLLIGIPHAYALLSLFEGMWILGQAGDACIPTASMLDVFSDPVLMMEEMPWNLTEAYEGCVISMQSRGQTSLEYIVSQLQAVRGCDVVLGEGFDVGNARERLFRILSDEYACRLGMNREAGNPPMYWDACAHRVAGRHMAINSALDPLFGTLLMGMERLGLEMDVSVARALFSHVDYAWLSHIPLWNRVDEVVNMPE